MPKKTEKETIINWAEGDDFINVYTCNRKLQNRLGKLDFEPDDDDKDSSGGLTFSEVPIEYLQFRKPREYEYTEEEREAARVRFLKNTGRESEIDKKKAPKGGKTVTETAKAGKNGATAKTTGKKKVEPEPEPETSFEEEEVKVLAVNAKKGTVKVEFDGEDYEMFMSADVDFDDFEKGASVTIDAEEDEEGDLVITKLYPTAKKGKSSKARREEEEEDVEIVRRKTPAGKR